MQNRFWIVTAIFDIILSCISIAYLGNEKAKTSAFTVNYTLNDYTPWTDALGACNASCKGECNVTPQLVLKQLDAESNVYHLLVYLNVFAFTSGVGMLGLVSHQINCKQTCLLQLVLGMLCWLCGGWSYEFGGVYMVVLGLVGLAVQCFSPLLFTELWRKRDDLSFAIIVFIQILVSMPVMLLMAHFAAGRTNVYLMVLHIVLGAVLTLSMLAHQIECTNSGLNHCVMLLAVVALFMVNYPHHTHMRSADALSFIAPLYTVILLSNNVRYLYGFEVMLRLLVIMGLLHELVI